MPAPENAKFYKVYKNWIDLIGTQKVKEKEIKFTPYHVLVLARIANWENQNLPCYMTNEQFAKYVDCSTRTAATIISTLNKLGLIEIQKNGKRRILKLADKAYECKMMDAK